MQFLLKRISIIEIFLLDFDVKKFMALIVYIRP